MNATTIPIDFFENAPSYASSLATPQEKIVSSRSVNHFDDEMIIAGLKARDILIINYIYKQVYPQIRYLVTSNSGSRMDAEDLFQDTLVVIYQKITKDSLNLTSSFKTYLYSICRHLWLQKLNKHQFSYEYKDVSDLDEFQDNQDNEELLEENEKYRLFQQHFLKMSANDQKVLKLYLAKTSLREMARIMGYKSDNYAKFRKYICKEKLKNAILNDPQFRQIYQYDDLVPAMNG